MPTTSTFSETAGLLAKPHIEDQKNGTKGGNMKNIGIIYILQY